MTTPLPPDAGRILTGLARASIAKQLSTQSHPDAVRTSTPEGADAAWLDAPGAVFVTLTQSGQLRGCIGSLVAHRPLRDDVVQNAQAAAFGDPRFPTLRAGEFEGTDIEVSVLSEPEPMPFTSRDDALAQLRPGIDGVILSAGFHRATFLPQVWEELPDKEQFIGHLFRKAGLPSNYWGDDVRISRYTVTAFEERPS